MDADNQLRCCGSYCRNTNVACSEKCLTWMWADHISESPKPSFGISWHRHYREILHQKPEYLPSDPCYGSHWTMYASWAPPSSSSCSWYSSLQQRKGPILSRCLGKLFFLSVKKNKCLMCSFRAYGLGLEDEEQKGMDHPAHRARFFETCYTGITIPVNTTLWPCADNFQLY